LVQAARKVVTNCIAKNVGFCFCRTDIAAFSGHDKDEFSLNRIRSCIPYIPAETRQHTSKSGKLEAQNLFIGISSFGAAMAVAGFVHKGGFAGTGS
jgi:hypothetical protein